MACRTGLLGSERWFGPVGDRSGGVASDQVLAGSAACAVLVLLLHSGSGSRSCTPVAEKHIGQPVPCSNGKAVAPEYCD